MVSSSLFKLISWPPNPLPFSSSLRFYRFYYSRLYYISTVGQLFYTTSVNYLHASFLDRLSLWPTRRWPNVDAGWLSSIYWILSFYGTCSILVIRTSMLPRCFQFSPISICLHSSLSSWRFHSWWKLLLLLGNGNPIHRIQILSKMSAHHSERIPIWH